MAMIVTGGASGERITGPVFRFFLLVFVALVAAMPVRNASAQVAPPTFTKTFTPDTIGPTSTTTLRFDITNTGSTPVSSVAFSDTLPPE